MAARPSAPARRALVTLSLVLTLVATIGLGVAAAQDDDVVPVLDEALLEEVLEILGEQYVDEDKLDSENLTLGAIRGIVDALGDDGHTLYLTPAELEVEEDLLDSRVVGIGVRFDQRGGSSRIISVVDGSPADQARLRAGDVIAGVDGTDINRLSADDLVEALRGDVGTMVRLEVERPGGAELLEVVIRRDDVEIDPVAWAFAPGSDVAVIRIVQFSAQSGRETRAAIKAALEAGASGIVLDLRGNPGGLVEEALVVAGSFLLEGVAYQEQGREGPPRNIHITTGWTLTSDLPLVVLVDYGTASAAEMLAAALRDNDRAAIVGEQTFGTGTTLHTFRLSDGSALRVGVLDWLTPSGNAVFRVGVTPDEVVALPPGSLALQPGDLAGMTASDFADSDDAPLRHAVSLIEALADGGAG